MDRKQHVSKLSAHSHTSYKNSQLCLKVNSWEINRVIILDLCGSSIQ